jgi:hypothetical protein
MSALAELCEYCRAFLSSNIVRASKLIPVSLSDREFLLEELLQFQINCNDGSNYDARTKVPTHTQNTSTIDPISVGRTRFLLVYQEEASDAWENIVASMPSSRRKEEPFPLLHP